MKPLLPTLKEKKRYLVFEVVSKKPVKLNKVELMNKIHDFLGILSSSKAGIQLIKTKGNRGILRVSHKYVDHLKSALLFIKDLSDQDVILNTVTVSGILKKVEQRGGF